MFMIKNIKLLIMMKKILYANFIMIYIIHIVMNAKLVDFDILLDEAFVTI